jgi:nucleotide-binding universal stress UspA family protein
LLIVHVQEPVQPVIGGELAYLPSWDTDPDQLSAQLHKIVPDDPSLNYAHRLLQGDPATEIVDLAKAEHADMIVLGTHGRTGFARMLMGSTAEQILRRATCPVLAVKEPVPEPALA